MVPIDEMEESTSETGAYPNPAGESLEYYREIVENAHDAIFIVQDGKVQFPNRQAKEMRRSLGIDLQQVAFSDYIHPDDRGMVVARHLRRLQGEKLPAIYSFRLIGREEKDIWVQLNSVLIDWKGKPATLNFMRDISEQKKLEKQFHQAQKMEAIGNLAGGIAHDFNNLLMCIQGNAAVMLNELDSGHPHRDLAQGILRSVENGANLTRRLLGFARRGKYEFRPIDLNVLVQKTGDLFSRAKREISLHYTLEDAPWAVEADEGQIEQVLLNLYVNAWQAMTPGGSLQLRTRNLFVSPDNMPGLDLPAGKYVRVTVIDDGTGMDEDTLAKIFEPFFTTKEPGKGTGLGLASAWGIVQNHGGLIDVSSKPHAGTTFHVYLPACETTGPRTAGRAGMEKIQPLGSRQDHPDNTIPDNKVTDKNTTVLIVDDDSGVLETLTRMLKHNGCRVFAALSGRKAVEIYRETRERIDIVVLDMIMPEMGGIEAFNRIRQLNPEARFVLSSGYSISEDVVRLLDSGGVGFLQKPYNPDLLVSKIHRILNRFQHER